MFLIPYLAIKIRYMLDYQTKRSFVFLLRMANEYSLELVRILFLPLNQSFLHFLMECVVFWKANYCEAFLRFEAHHKFFGNLGSLCIVLKVCNFKFLNGNFKGGSLFTALIFSIFFVFRLGWFATFRFFLFILIWLILELIFFNFVTRFLVSNLCDSQFAMNSKTFQTLLHRGKYLFGALVWIILKIWEWFSKIVRVFLFWLKGLEKSRLNEFPILDETKTFIEAKLETCFCFIERNLYFSFFVN